MRLRKRGRNEYYVKPNCPNTGSNRCADEYLVSGRIWGNVGAVILLVLFVGTVLVVPGEHSFHHQQEGKTERSI